MTGNIIRP